jgi:hypothetical protein
MAEASILFSEKERKDFTPEQIELFKDLLDNSNEAFSNIFIPLVLVNREKTIMHLKKAKEDVEKLLEII